MRASPTPRPATPTAAGVTDQEQSKSSAKVIPPSGVPAVDDESNSTHPSLFPFDTSWLDSPRSSSTYHPSTHNFNLESSPDLLWVPWSADTALDLSLPFANIQTVDGGKDHDIADWDGPNDPENPLNWSGLKKWAAVSIISIITLISTLASSMFAPGIAQVMDEFRSTNSALSSFVISIFILGYAFGPLFIAPLSEMFGRLYVYHISNILFTIFLIACGKSTSLGMLITFRFLAGVPGSTPVALGGATVADMFAPRQRGKAMAVWSLGPLIGGGFLAEAKGWRWVFYLGTLLMAIMTVISLLVLRESNEPTLLARKARRLRREPSGNPHLRGKYEKNIPRSAILAHALMRPTKMLVQSPIVLSLSLYLALVYGYLYLLFTTFPIVFTNVYSLPTSFIGLTYTGLGVGTVLGSVLFGYLSDKLLVKTPKPSKSASARLELPLNRNTPTSPRPDSTPQRPPEDRLRPLLPSSLLLSTGLLLFGWLARPNISLFAPVAGSSLVGLGLIGVFMPALTYLVDIFAPAGYAASAIAANTVLRSLGGALLPLAGVGMFEKLTVGWGCTLLAGLCIGLGVPAAWGITRYGKLIREKYPVKL